MKNFKTYFGAISLILLTAQCSLFPWNPLNPEPEPEPEPKPVYFDEYYVAIYDTVDVQFKSYTTIGSQWSWVNKDACTHVDSLSFTSTPIVGPQYMPALNDSVLNPPGFDAGSIEKWRFVAKSLGTDTLEFVNNRPDNTKIGMEATKTVLVHVGEEPVVIICPRY